MTVEPSQPTTGFFGRVDHFNDAPKSGYCERASDAGVRRAQNHRMSGRAYPVDSTDQDAEARGIHERDSAEVYDYVRVEGRSLSQALAQLWRGKSVNLAVRMNENVT